MAEYAIRLITAPTTEPVTTTEAKAHCVVEHSSDDTLFASLIKASRLYVEKRTHRAVMRQKWRVYFDGFCDVLPLCKGPVLSVDSVNYIDENGDAQVVGGLASPNNPGAFYELDIANECVRLAYQATWPNTQYKANAVWVDFWAGYADTSASPQGTSPEDLKAAILLIVGDLYEHREMQSEMELYANKAVDFLLSGYWMPQ